MKTPSAIPNKIKRSQVYQKQKVEKNKEKRQKRIEKKKEVKLLGDKAPPKSVPKTLENTRESDPTFVEPDDEEVVQDEQQDELSDYFKGRTPKLLITTNRKPVGDSFIFINELLNTIPNSHFRRRQKFDLKLIVKFCNNQDFTDIMVITENNKKPNSITLMHLPDGPTANFKLTSIKLPKQIANHGRATSHYPELILNQFNTRLGHQVGRMFAVLFPQNPNFKGRQVVTFHNQRDFIFFRRHRYIFKDGKKVRLQELGPRFTLKLRWLQNGTFDTKYGEYEWHHKTHMDTSRRRFFL
eukprot:Lithocolla_globosa_v1_NODE_157_length_5627_cov_12.255922.p3 type:complete len:297 gc:universal NODE_157_length_5627_cov_12.255922:3883-2993(-)